MIRNYPLNSLPNSLLNIKEYCEVPNFPYHEYYENISEVMVPTWTGKSGKPGKWEHFFRVREKWGNFTQDTGKVRDF